MNKRKLVIDCDPGTDDAFALFMLLADERLDILGLTAVAGNVPLSKTGVNALKICEFMGRGDIPVASGAARPMVRGSVTAEEVHGESGLGDLILPEPKGHFHPLAASDFIFEKARECGGELEIMAIGPLTNLGIALIKYPGLKAMIKKLHIMGGAITQGNVTAAAEFNIYADPDAAKIVFESGIPINLFDLDACRFLPMLAEDVRSIRALGGKVSDAAAVMADGCVRSVEELEKIQGAGERIVPAMCDSLVSAFLLCPEIYEMKSYYCEVETKGEITMGRTAVDWYDFRKNTHNVNIPVSADKKRYMEEVLRSLAAANGKV